jgi:hypothetical protein
MIALSILRTGASALLCVTTAGCLASKSLEANWYMVENSDKCLTTGRSPARPCVFVSLTNRGPEAVTIDRVDVAGVPFAYPGPSFSLPVGGFRTFRLTEFDCAIPTRVTVHSGAVARNVELPRAGTTLSAGSIEACDPSLKQ